LTWTNGQEFPANNQEASMSEARRNRDGTPEHSAVQSARKPVAKCLNCGYLFLQRSWFATSKCPKCKNDNLSYGSATVSTANIDRAESDSLRCSSFRWPRGRYNGKRIMGASIKCAFDMEYFSWAPRWIKHANCFSWLWVYIWIQWEYEL